MDRAQTWCLEIEQEYNKAEVHSINTSKGDTEDVGIFSDNSQTMVFAFLESTELAYLGWGNSVQKARSVSTCSDFFNFSPMDRWEKIEKGRMCYSCLNQRMFANQVSMRILQVFLKS